MNKVIETEDLTKKFGKVTAVKNVSLTVNKGEIYGFLGLNGAGKTTTIRILTGMIAPTKGSAYISGKKIKRGDYATWKSVGCIVEVPYSYPDLTVYENLDIMRRLKGISDKNSVKLIMDKLKLTEYSGRKAGHLSLGNSQRLGLAKAMMHDPEILILDEPSNGLDPEGIVETRELLQNLSKNHSVTIFISSHILGEISKIADRIGIIHKGELIQEINSNELDNLVKKRLLIRTRDNISACKLLKKKGYNPHMNKKDNYLEMTDEESLNSPEVIATKLVALAVPPQSLFIEEEDLESYFLRVIRQKENNYE
ncbi:MAG: ABC transporter ATP-binding protein [Spirochaetes bacterium]|nr:ABC transporter ATP-binding protein [Spirochaetota bacterium]